MVTFKKSIKVKNLVGEIIFSLNETNQVLKTNSISELKIIIVYSVKAVFEGKVIEEYDNITSVEILESCTIQLENKLKLYLNNIANKKT